MKHIETAPMRFQVTSPGTSRIVESIPDFVPPPGLVVQLDLEGRDYICIEAIGIFRITADTDSPTSGTAFPDQPEADLSGSEGGEPQLNH